MGVLPLIYYLLISWFCGEKEKEKTMPKDQLPFLEMIAHAMGMEDRGTGFKMAQTGVRGISNCSHSPSPL